MLEGPSERLSLVTCPSLPVFTPASLRQALLQHQHHPSAWGEAGAEPHHMHGGKLEESEELPPWHTGLPMGWYARHCSLKEMLRDLPSLVDEDLGNPRDVTDPEPLLCLVFTLQPQHDDISVHGDDLQLVLFLPHLLFLVNDGAAQQVDIQLRVVVFGALVALGKEDGRQVRDKRSLPFCLLA